MDPQVKSDTGCCLLEACSFLSEDGGEMDGGEERWSSWKSGGRETGQIHNLFHYGIHNSDFLSIVLP